MARHEYKLVFTGTMGVGKTTAIAAISEIEPVRTEVQNTDLAANDKATTTIAMDYGEVTLAGGEKLRLYGTPGQVRFEFMWKILAKGAMGVVFLVDHSRSDPVADLRTYLSAFASAVHDSSAVVGVGRTETNPAIPMHAYHQLLAELGLSIPVFSVDVRRREDVLLLLDVLFHQIEAAEGQVA
jgi:signal recognition particle receptor subunit beta